MSRCNLLIFYLILRIQRLNSIVQQFLAFFRDIFGHDESWHEIDLPTDKVSTAVVGLNKRTE